MELATTQPEAKKVSALAVLASKLNLEPKRLHETLKATVFKGASDEELVTLVVVANEYGLNPLIKELYAFPAKGGGIVPIVSVDGWIRMINDHPQMDGMETEYVTEAGKLVACTCRIYRKDRSKPTVVTEYLSECRRNTEPWKMEHRMLRHKAIMQCGRVSFGFSGIHDEDEGNDISERPAKGRVVHQQTVDPFTLPDEAQSDPEPPAAPRRAISARDDFWQQVDDNNADRDDVMTILVRRGITSEAYPADVSDAELAWLLADPVALRGIIAEAKTIGGAA